ncbi:hypothetical protein [Streptomyces sp. NPDC020965]|uniref:hypothetical protein n=1 Tax=Streptomyces sp. NPDC020965 TaxID=3365105 RepID=UPI0037B4E9C2
MPQPHRLDTAEYQTAQGLKTALERLFKPLREAFRYSDDSHEVHKIKDRYWIDLVLITLPWRAHPDFDTARWRSTEFYDPAHEGEMAAYYRSNLR